MRVTRKMNHHLNLIFLTSLLGFSGCTALWGSEEPAPTEKKGEFKSESSATAGTEVAVKPLRLPDGRELSDIEVILEAPRDPIDGFIIKYGSSADALTQIKRVDISELQKVASPPGADARYRFLLRSIPNNQRVFFTVSSFRGESSSAESSVIEVK